MITYLLPIQACLIVASIVTDCYEAIELGLLDSETRIQIFFYTLINTHTYIIIIIIGI